MLQLPGYAADLHHHGVWPKPLGGAPACSHIHTVVSLSRLVCWTFGTEGFSEEKIDIIQQRLDGIEHLLSELLENSNKPVTDPPSCSTTLAHTFAPAFEEAAVPPGTPTRSTLAAQTLDVGAMVENTVKQTPSVRADPDVDAALSALHRMVQMHHQKPVASEIRFPDRETLPEASILGLPLVPLNVALPLLRGAKGKRRPLLSSDSRRKCID